MALRIRSEQMHVFEEEQKRRFVAALIENLRHDIPHSIEGIPQDVLEKRVAYAAARSLEYLRPDIESKIAGKALSLWIRLMFEVGPTFDQHPVVRAILDDPASPRPDRVFALLRRTSKVPWRDVAAQRATWPQ